MKNLYLIIFSFFLSINAIAQNNTFPTENAIWINQTVSYYHDFNGVVYEPPSYYKFCASGVDTIINSLIYTEIDRCSNVNSNYFGAIREDSSKVFFIPKDSTSEFLLYDFNVNIGDTVEVIYMSMSSTNNFYMQSFIVEDTSTTIINNKTRRVIQIYGYSWIEGIGSNSGLFIEPFPNISNYFVDLTCVSVNDTIIYEGGGAQGGGGNILQQGIPGICDLTLDVPEIEAIDNITLYPNPTNGNISIQTNNENQIKQITTINSIGKTLTTIQVSDKEILEFNIEGAPGIYFIEVYYTEGQKSVQKIIKN